MARNSGTPTNNKSTGPTVPQLKAELDTLGANYPKSALKPALEALLAEAKVNPPEPVASMKSAAGASAVIAGKPTVIVANQTMAPIIFPRKGKGATIAPLVIPPGTAIPIGTEEWEKRKKNKIVQAYLDHHLLAEVPREGSVPVSSSTTSDLPIPEHLQDAKESESEGKVKGMGVTKSTPGTVEIT